MYLFDAIIKMALLFYIKPSSFQLNILITLPKCDQNLLSDINYHIILTYDIDRDIVIGH